MSGGGPLLLHLCCGPCAAGSLPRLRAEGWDVEGFFDNPNIHPVTEWQARMAALREYAVSVGLPVTWREDYGLVGFVRAVAGREGDRCVHCYTVRLRATALEAARRGIHRFSTTLLYSVHQDHNLVRDVGEQVAREAGVGFLYLDLREGWAEGKARWRGTGLYSQKYCGCVYSEMERYRGGTGASRGEAGD